MWYLHPEKNCNTSASSAEFPSINYLRKLVISSNLVFCKLCVGVLVPLDLRHGITNWKYIRGEGCFEAGD